MASIVGGRAVRETRDRKHRDGKPLVYGIGDVDPDLALRIHHWVYGSWMGEESRSQATPDIMRAYLDILSKEKDESRWRLAAQSASWKSYGKKLAKHHQKWDEEPIPSNDIPALIKSFNHYQALNHYCPYLPGKASDSVKRNLVLALLKNGSLNRKVGSKEENAYKLPTSDYRNYLDTLAPVEQGYARLKFQEIQQVLGQGARWLEYFKSIELRKIDQVDATHVKGYIAWRKKNAKRPTWYGEVSDRMIRAELKYLSAVGEYGAAKGVLLRNPAKGVTMPKHRIATDSKVRANEPLTMDEVRNMIEILRAKFQDAKDKKSKTAEDVKLNFYTVLFLILTGCRPKEAGQFTVSADMISFHRTNLSGGQGGKTSYAARRIRMTPVLRTIAKDGILSRNEDVIDLSSRVHQFLERAGLDVTPYRLRHTVSTIRFKAEGENAPQIAYELGHADPAFTFKKYTNLDTYAECSVDEAKTFWHWLHHHSLKG